MIYIKWPDNLKYRIYMQCINYNEMYTDNTVHVYLKRKDAKSLKLWMPPENQNWTS